MQGESTDVRHAPYRPGRSLAVLALLAGALAARPVHAEERDVTVTTEASAGRDYRAWSLLGDVGLREDTFLTLGYTAARPEAGTAATHQLSVGVDHVLGGHWLVAAVASVGLPKRTRTELSAERPRLNLPAVDARTGYSSQAVLLSAAYDSAGFSDVEFGVDAGLSLTRYPLSREILVVNRSGATVRYAQEELLWVARPSVGSRLLLGTRWEVGVRAGLTLYSEDPLTAGGFTDEETAELTRRFENAVEARRALLGLSTRINRDLGSGVAQRVSELNATTGIPTAPSRFDVKPSVTWSSPGRVVRGQLSYAFTRYVSGEGLSHVLATRWTVRLGEPVRVWASVALQQDRLEAAESTDTPGEATRSRSGLFTVGGEYTF
ncbi:hypothetical protein JY651_08720 [Pyxidicoccus parkwayensis]|uniref:Uncharacterized protein n=1 Tax=Pyxidicoccus parkwayensis TaxID=2813578 RepID=A0ABX7P3F5_9BACT|nr:hypothetical protein [Pyxidicoccus parkwaysis]QSQ24997.1 hypothetical protein JY651_08720 [Pyxidicoccus parkwaysis]